MWRAAVGLLVALTVGTSGSSLARAPASSSPAQVPRVGVLRHDAPPSRFIEDFRQGLRGLGYVEGRDLILELRWAEGDLERLPALAAELVRLPVDVIVTSGPPAVRAARAATSDIPIVMGRIDDADAQGFVASLARPGGNVTGLSFQTGEISAKWLQFLMEVLPPGARVAAIWYPTSTRTQRDTLQATADDLRVPLRVLEVPGRDELDRAFAAVRSIRADGVVILASPVFTVNAPRLADLAARSRLPAVYYHRGFAEAGGLLSYGPREADGSWGWGRAAVFVDKLLKGADPGELPVEQPTNFELVVNLEAAAALGLTVPPSLLLQADEVLGDALPRAPDPNAVSRADPGW